MSVAVLENIAPTEAAARAITTAVTELVTIAARHPRPSRELKSLSTDTEQQLIGRTGNPVANAYSSPLHASSHNAHQFPQLMERVPLDTTELRLADSGGDKVVLVGCCNSDGRVILPEQVFCIVEMRAGEPRWAFRDSARYDYLSQGESERHSWS